MGIRKDSYDYIGYLLFSFIMSGIIHVALYKVPFSDSITQIWNGIVIVFWGGTLYDRIENKRLSHCCNAIVFLLFFNLILQITKYSFINYEPLWFLNFLEYLYYIPFIVIPFLFLIMALTMFESNNRNTDRKAGILLMCAFIMVMTVMTNDLHHWFAAVDYDGSQKASIHKWFFYFVYAVVLIIIIVAAILFVKRYVTCFDEQFSTKRALIIRTFIIFLCFYSLQLIPKIRGTHIWNPPDINIYISMLLIEFFIYKGFIPSNSGHFRIFTKLTIPVKINGKNGSYIVRTDEPFNLNNNKELCSMPIPGGEVQWIVDLSEINQLNESLKELSQKIEKRNEYLRTANKIKEEQAIDDAQNKLYDKISKLVRSQLDKIQLLIDEDFEKNLPFIAILNAYIKRRSNMELLKAGSDNLSLLELNTALKESCDYIKISNIDTAVTCKGIENIPCDLVILSYEFFEYVIENNIRNLKALAIFVKSEENSLSMRLIIQAESFEINTNWCRDKLNDNSAQILIAGDNNDYICNLHFDIKENSYD